MHFLLGKPPGDRLLLMGNEAICRGALEAGVAVASAYPGTPSSEISNNLFALSQEAGNRLYFEFSVNEKVAMEVAAAAGAAGLRSLTCMKHVGLNVASDVLLTLAYVGTEGGMVIVTADDPAMHSSQNEQDNRLYARFANLPMLEPTTPQEAKDMTAAAFEISEALKLPVILRTTTRTSHMRGPVTLGPIPAEKRTRGAFQADYMRWIPVPLTAKIRHGILLEQIEKGRDLAEASPFNRIEGTGPLGILASGAAACYVADAIRELGAEDEVTFLRLGFTFPPARNLFRRLLAGTERVLVVEELEPFQEEALRLVAQEAGLATPILGKGTGHFTRLNEYSPAEVTRVIAELLGRDPAPPEQPDFSELPELPLRPPSLCPGCPHHATFTAARTALEELGLAERTIYPADIGCYTLAVLPPIQMSDYLLCMGSSIGTSAGFSVATDQNVVAFIGDSTFFHAGIPSLINAVHNRHRFCLVILDNSTTAMTGHQPHPGATLTPPGYDRAVVPIERVVRACGVDMVKRIDPYRTEEAVAAFKEAFTSGALSVVIAEAPCLLYKKKLAGRAKA
ncbi:indolepyruvate ferredoxin oxidoreductase subunit alpha [Dissulfurirhabdus thermomarina]|uniref:Indolepyruvate oxidoreductase subunit IorA n=1 Tax=Dissulfurirhabdus thermomarina TaxID=1765737 RepID=A0A6N9TSC3_DISTH|nr:indolepyruvate ferredoxin oxidoreductase subunit alpha [Dissulfurirhabdus thermomarina]NDY42993.1 indolepyruvate ferredoxin oxidoreductase subunit alpha [Dissulfurirhabdus thermomarina]NMX22715.1 indolepyruvate ferredoxin oxidoreductase subunit alpha [Dissulfurirhabdus thermomarina]